jgi:hypothetical protein
MPSGSTRQQKPSRCTFRSELRGLLGSSRAAGSAVIATMASPRRPRVHTGDDGGVAHQLQSEGVERRLRSHSSCLPVQAVPTAVDKPARRSSFEIRCRTVIRSSRHPRRPAPDRNCLLRRVGHGNFHDLPKIKQPVQMRGVTDLGLDSNYREGVAVSRLRLDIRYPPPSTPAPTRNRSDLPHRSKDTGPGNLCRFQDFAITAQTSPRACCISTPSCVCIRERSV